MSAPRSLGTGRGIAKCSADERPHGFTFVELLVILAVLAVLALTMIPVFANARPNSLAFQCMNNLRQWSVAMRTMASDNNDMMARDGTDDGVPRRPEQSIQCHQTESARISQLRLYDYNAVFRRGEASRALYRYPLKMSKNQFFLPSAGASKRVIWSLRVT